MNKRDLRLLERVFEYDIQPGRIFQSKSKEYERLEKEGYVQKISYTIPATPGCPFLPIKVEGWTLTILGNLTVCASCEGEEEKDE